MGTKAVLFAPILQEASRLGQTLDVYNLQLLLNETNDFISNFAQILENNFELSSDKGDLTLDKPLSELFTKGSEKVNFIVRNVTKFNDNDSVNVSNEDLELENEGSKTSMFKFDPLEIEKEKQSSRIRKESTIQFNKTLLSMPVLDMEYEKIQPPEMIDPLKIEAVSSKVSRKRKNCQKTPLFATKVGFNENNQVENGQVIKRSVMNLEIEMLKEETKQDENEKVVKEYESDILDLLPDSKPKMELDFEPLEIINERSEIEPWNIDHLLEMAKVSSGKRKRQVQIWKKFSTQYNVRNDMPPSKRDLTKFIQSHPFLEKRKIVYEDLMSVIYVVYGSKTLFSYPDFSSITNIESERRSTRFENEKRGHIKTKKRERKTVFFEAKELAIFFSKVKLSNKSELMRAALVATFYFGNNEMFDVRIGHLRIEGKFSLNYGLKISSLYLL